MKSWSELRDAGITVNQVHRSGPPVSPPISFSTAESVIQEITARSEAGHKIIKSKDETTNSVKGLPELNGQSTQTPLPPQASQGEQSDADREPCEIPDVTTLTRPSLDA